MSQASWKRHDVGHGNYLLCMMAYACMQILEVLHIGAALGRNACKT